MRSEGARLKIGPRVHLKNQETSEELLELEKTQKGPLEAK
jgi:hypothetical protein